MANKLKRPIIYANVTVQFLKNKKWGMPEVCEGVVASGTKEQIMKDSIVLYRILSRIKGRDQAKKFDLSKIKITKIEEIFELGNGFMKAEKENK